MKKRIIYWPLAIICFSFFCCAQEQIGEDKTIAKINDYVLTLDEFQVQLAEELELDREFKLTKEAKKDFLDRLITKEILIQEAKNLELDRREKFMRTIERYWESTLIRDLMEMKGQAIEKRTVVSEEEIQMKYKKMKEQEESLPPLETIRDKVSQRILADKKSKILAEWVNKLKKKATIEINQKLLLKN